ncbi:verrucotoxin subunit beta-like [Scyliorhinus canicula]|uniref:verrucotoxin subunit beta-like n=1 Tax=Scyliorhinus canicula TaxID=7830 RepID=UPI0018F60A22|nr:verrucotoxin subunit beta-like [Scyliorhinus canicula]
MAGGGHDLFQIPTLGRPLRLGMLYDRRSDTIIPGVTLWDLAELKNIDVQPKPSTDFKLISSDSIQDKASALGVEASLTASFLGGLVEVSGSAKYLNDVKKSSEVARLTLKYRATTRFEELTMSQLGPQHITYPSVLEQDSATHVVTGVLYGAEAFFVFDRDYSSSDNVQDVEGSLHVMVKKIPTFQIEGKGSLKLSDAERKTVESFSCTFHGDFLLDRNPVSYQEAIEVYASLPKLLGEQAEKAVPLTAWLFPLKRLSSKAAQIVREISIKLVNRCQMDFDQYRDIEMRCNDLIKSPAHRAFSELKVKVESFKARCVEKQTVFQKELSEILPSIRGMGKEESVLADMLTQKDQSPFSYSCLNTWLEQREKEADTVQGYLAMLGGVDVLTYRHLGKVLTDPIIQSLVCFAFTSLGETDPYLQELSNHLRSPQSWTEPGLTPQGHTIQLSQAWFNDESVSHRMREWASQFQQFTDFYKSCDSEISKIAIASVDEKGCPGASVFLYEQGVLVNKELTLQKPGIPVICGVSGSSVTLQLKAPVDNTGPVVMFKVGYKAVGDKDWHWDDAEAGAETFTVSELHPHTQYQLRLAPVYKPWIGLLGEPTDRVLTLLAKSPGQVSLSDVLPTSLTVSWAPPALVGDGVSIGHYIIEYQRGESQEGPWSGLRTEGPSCVYSLDSLSIGTPYRVRVTADCGVAGRSAPSQEVMTVTPREKTPAQLADTIRRESKLVKAGRPAVYQLPLAREADPYCQTFNFGTAGSSANHRTIVLFETDESGMDDFVNGLINYILGVDWEDGFRFQLTEDPREWDKVIWTIFKIHHQEGFRVPFSLTIKILTPKLLNMLAVILSLKVLKMFDVFKQFNDFVGILVKSSAVSLDNRISKAMTLFPGAKPQLLITSCDEQSPAIVRALQNSQIPFLRDGKGFPVHYCFNLSGLFAANRCLPELTAEGRGSTNFNALDTSISKPAINADFNGLGML